MCVCVCRLTVHRLAAQTLIRALEAEQREESGQPEEGLKKKVIELSVQSGVSSSFTAFIAVNKDINEPIKGPLTRRNVPIPGECSKVKVTFSHKVKEDLSLTCEP